MISIVATTSNSFAFQISAIELKQNQPAPYAGVLLKDDLAKKIYTQLQYCDKVIETNTSLMKSIELYKDNETQFQKEIQELKTVNGDLTVAVDNANKNSFWKNTLYFSLGVLTTTAIVYATRPH